MTPAVGPPPSLPGFERVQRYWDARGRTWVAQVLPGEFFVTRAEEVISTVLGSCVATCIRDRGAGVGGINHFMLPFGAGGPPEAATRYGCFAVERLINEILKHGGRRPSLEVKVFGGASLIRGLGDIGRANVDFIHGYLKGEGLAIAAQDVGGDCARRLRYHPRSGQALIKRLSASDAEGVASRETELGQSLARRPPNDVELF
jgi:chemotaxis protein CheD